MKPPYAFEEEESDEVVEINLHEVVPNMTKEQKRQVTKLSVEYYENARKIDPSVTYEECTWQAFAEYVAAIYGTSEEIGFYN